MDARVLVPLLQRKARTFRGLHVHAHDGHPWNEFVDSIAGPRRKGWCPPIETSFRSGPLLRHRLGVILRNDVPNPDVGHVESILKSQQDAKPLQPIRNKFQVATINGWYTEAR